MKLSDVKDPYATAPVLTADGRKWTQRCYVCSKPVNFIRDAKFSWLQIGPLVRHEKCVPPPLR